MNISLVLSTDSGLKECHLPEELLLELIQSIKENGSERVILKSGASFLVNGIYIPGKDNNSVIMILPGSKEVK